MYIGVLWCAIHADTCRYISACCYLEGKQEGWRNIGFCHCIWYGSVVLSNIMKHFIKEKHVPKPCRVTVLVWEDAEFIDIIGAVDVFAIANYIYQEKGGKQPIYQVEIAAKDKKEGVKTSSGIRLAVHQSLEDIVVPDILLLIGGSKSDVIPDEVLEKITLLTPKVKRIGAISVHENILRQIGMSGQEKKDSGRLDLCMRMKKQKNLYPLRKYENTLHAGAFCLMDSETAGIDLSLCFVEEDFDSEFSLLAAKLIALHLRRSNIGAVCGFTFLEQAGMGKSLEPTVRWICKHYQEKLTNESLAEHACMSLRNFFRVFKQETEMTPARFVEQIRLQAAVGLLEKTEQPLDEVAAHTGFPSAEQLRLIFVRNFGVTPNRYRKFREKNQKTISNYILDLNRDKMLSYCLSFDAEDFVRKPFDFKLLMAGIQDCVSQFRLDKEVVVKNERLFELATRDEGTGFYNPLYLMDVYKKKAEEARRNEQPFAFSLLQIRRFEEISQQYPEQDIRLFLKELANLLAESLRKSDILCRWDHDKILVLLNRADGKSALFLAERMKKRLEEHKFQKIGGIGVSFAATQWQKDDDEESIFERLQYLLEHQTCFQ